MLLPPTQQAARPVAPRSRLDRPHSRELGATQGGPSSTRAKGKRDAERSYQGHRTVEGDAPGIGEDTLRVFQFRASMKHGAYASLLQASSSGIVNVPTPGLAADNPAPRSRVQGSPTLPWRPGRHGVLPNGVFVQSFIATWLRQTVRHRGNTRRPLAGKAARLGASASLPRQACRSAERGLKRRVSGAGSWRHDPRLWTSSQSTGSRFNANDLAQCWPLKVQRERKTAHQDEAGPHWVEIELTP
jgi:hypothetical protein